MCRYRFDDSYSYNRRMALQEYLRTLARTKYIRLTSKTFQEFLQIPEDLMDDLITQLQQDAADEEMFLMSQEGVAEAKKEKQDAPIKVVQQHQQQHALQQGHDEEEDLETQLLSEDDIELDDDLMGELEEEENEQDHEGGGEEGHAEYEVQVEYHLDYDGYNKTTTTVPIQKHNGNKKRLTHRDSILETSLLQVFDDNGQAVNTKTRGR